jgi:predicted nuclease of predicted toxin-antitoxin system
MIFIDRSIPRGVADALKAVRGDVSWFEDHFPHDTKDVTWLPIAGQNDWLVVARDKKIRTRAGERHMIEVNNVGCFIISQKQNLTRWEYLKLLARSLDQMEEIFQTKAHPFICKVDASGRFAFVA